MSLNIRQIWETGSEQPSPTSVYVQIPVDLVNTSLRFSGWAMGLESQLLLLVWGSHLEQ